MTVSSSDFSRVYAGDGNLLSCPFPLAFWEKSELNVVRVAASGAETALVMGTDYTITGGVKENGVTTYPNGCTIAYPEEDSGLPNLPVDETLFAYVEIGFTQPTDFVNYSVDKDLLERELDRGCRRDIHLKRQYDLTIRYPVSTDPASVLDAATYLSTLESHKNAAEVAKTASETAETNAETAETAAEAAQAAAEAAVGGVKVSLDDTTAGDLETKLLVATGLTLSTQNSGGNETRTITPVPASATASGIVELATDAEAQTGTDTGRALTPANLAAVLGAFSGTITSVPASDQTASGLLATLTAGETGGLVFGDLCYLKSDGKLWKADADTATTMPGVAMALGSLDADASGTFLLRGFVRDDSWSWTVGGALFASTTAGGLTQTAPSGAGDQLQAVGLATDADRMLFSPDVVTGEIAT
jgi:hypothetical protein